MPDSPFVGTVSVAAELTTVGGIVNEILEVVSVGGGLLAAGSTAGKDGLDRWFACELNLAGAVQNCVVLADTPAIGNVLWSYHGVVSLRDGGLALVSERAVIRTSSTLSPQWYAPASNLLGDGNVRPILSEFASGKLLASGAALGSVVSVTGDVGCRFDVGPGPALRYAPAQPGKSKVRFVQFVGVETLDSEGTVSIASCGLQLIDLAEDGHASPVGPLHWPLQAPDDRAGLWNPCSDWLVGRPRWRADGRLDVLFAGVRHGASYEQPILVRFAENGTIELMALVKQIDASDDSTSGLRAADLLGDGHVLSGTIEPAGLGATVFLSRSDDRGVRQWTRIVGKGSGYGIGGRVARHSSRGYAVVMTGGKLTMTDAFGHASAETAGKCAGVRFDACDDGNPCTRDDCDGDKGCINLPLPDGAECGDGLHCIAAQCVAS